MKKDNHIEIYESSDENSLAPEYVSPKITTYTEEQILDQIGPAHSVFSGANIT